MLQRVALEAFAFPRVMLHSGTNAYLFGAVDADEADRAVALVPVLPVAVLDADATVLADVGHRDARVGLGALLAAHALVTAAPAEKEVKFQCF